jgi:hypothetical protein
MRLAGGTARLFESGDAGFDEIATGVTGSSHKVLKVTGEQMQI